VLVPDFGRRCRTPCASCSPQGPDVLGHNLETVARLYPLVRPQADYGRRSGARAGRLDWAPRAASRTTSARETGRLASFPSRRPRAPALVKTGLMLGLGESGDEVERGLEDCAQAASTS
jgi:lipoyl synthase